MNIDQIETGDTYLTTAYNDFISRSIIDVMKKWNKKKGYSNDIVLSHACTFVWIADELYVYGSIDSGYKPWLFKKHYSLDDPNRGSVIMRRKKLLSAKEERQTINYIQHLVTVSFMYQYWMLIQWSLLVFFGINLFRRDSDKFTYCYESEYMRRKNLNPSNYGETFQVDFHMLIDDPNYEIVYSNLK